MENYEDSISEKALEIENRLVRSLDAKRESAGALSRARADLERVTDTYREAWKAALKAGWTEKELKIAGLSAPAASARPKRRTKPAAHEGE